MPTVLELREKRANIWAQAQEFDTRKKAGDTMSAEDEAAWARALDEVDTLGVEVANIERTAALDSTFAQIDQDTIVVAPEGGPSGKDEYRDAFANFCRRGMQGITPAEQALLQANFDGSSPEARALGESVGSAGGYTVPTGFWAKVTETMKYYGGALVGAEVINTNTAQNLPWPTNDDTANVGYMLGENTAAVNEGDLSFGQKQLGGYTFVSGPALVSLLLIQDTGIDVEGFVAKKIGQRIGRAENAKLTTGTGSSQPQGYITGATTGKTTGGSTAITYNELIDLEHSVDAAYRQTGRCMWKFNDLILAYIRKIRDDIGGAGLGRPLWQPGIIAGAPDTINGYPYAINNDMDSTLATTKKTVAFGDFESGFVVRKINGGQMMRLTERYAEFLQVGFLAFERADSLVQDSAAIKLLVQV